MTIIQAVAIVFIVAITIARAILNARIYNNLHDTAQEMMYTGLDTSSEEIERSEESVLFALYCSLIIIWIRFKKEDAFKVFINYILCGATAIVIYFAFLYP